MKYGDIYEYHNKKSVLNGHYFEFAYISDRGTITLIPAKGGASKKKCTRQISMSQTVFETAVSDGFYKLVTLALSKFSTQ